METGTSTTTCGYCGTECTPNRTRNGVVLCGDDFANRTAAELDAAL